MLKSHILQKYLNLAEEYERRKMVKKYTREEKRLSNEYMMTQKRNTQCVIHITEAWTP